MTRDEIVKLLPNVYFVEDAHVFAAFVETMCDREYGRSALISAWHWFKDGWFARQNHGD